MYSYRQAISVTVAVFVALLITLYDTYSREGWIVFAAFCVTQTSRGTPIKQSLYITFTIIIALIASSILLSRTAPELMLQIIVADVMVIAGLIIYCDISLQKPQRLYVLVFPLIFMIATLMSHVPNIMLFDQIADVVMGAMIGIICQQIISPLHPYKDMVVGLSPILAAFESYTSALSVYLLTNDNQLSNRRAVIEMTLQSSGKLYPEWVFETGYNPGLRAGYRYFMISLERISEMIFSIDYLIGENVKIHLSEQMKLQFSKVILHNGELFKVLAGRLKGETINYSDADFVEDITSLETELSRELPGTYEVLSHTQESMQIINLARDIKDMRTSLMQLLLSLPESI